MTKRLHYFAQMAIFDAPLVPRDLLYHHEEWAARSLVLMMLYLRCVLVLDLLCKHIDQLIDDWSNWEEIDRVNWNMKLINDPLVPHHAEDAKGPQLLQSEYVITFRRSQDEQNGFTWRDGMFQDGFMEMHRNFYYDCAEKKPKMKENSRAIDRDAMKPWTKPLQQYAFVGVNRDIAVTCLIIADYLNPNYGNKTIDGSLWRDMPYVKAITQILLVKTTLLVLFTVYFRFFRVLSLQTNACATTDCCRCYLFLSLQPLFFSLQPLFVSLQHTHRMLPVLPIPLIYLIIPLSSKNGFVKV